MFRLACLQTAGAPGDLSANLAELANAAAEATGANADLLVTPELFVTGYNIGSRLSEFHQLDLVAEIAKVARGAGIALLVGAPLWEAGNCYNVAHLIDADGALIGTYRKTHLFGEFDRATFRAGDRLVWTVPFRGIRLAVLICYDVEFPETVRAAAVAGAQLVIVPTALMTPYEATAEVLIPTRAWENQVYLAYVNHDGSEGDLNYVGRSSVVDPFGTKLAAVEHGTQLLLADIDPHLVTEAQRANPYLTDRRTDLYN
jgi:predicted amidohydrolase